MESLQWTLLLLWIFGTSISVEADKAICGDPGSIPYVFGTRFVEGTLEGSNVTYSCVPGLALIGDATRTCLSNGEWSGSVPTCSIVNCGQPPHILHGTVEYENLGFNFTATYSCNKGHILEGSKEVTCLQNNCWSTQPMCRAVQCPTLSDPANGIVRQSNSSMYLDEAVYQCHNQYGVVGDDTRVCMANGSWSGGAPVCEFGRCDELQNPQYGLVHYTNDIVNSFATYSCNIGYHLIGQVTRMCQVTGRWSMAAPICEPIVCSNITIPRHGAVQRSNENFVFSVAIHSCNAGYTLLGDVKRKCQPNCIWSSIQPVCQVVQCPFLDVPLNGNYSLTSRRCFKSEVWYRCNEGYTLHGGDMIRTCQMSRKWSGVAPVCIVSVVSLLPSTSYLSTEVHSGNTAVLISLFPSMTSSPSTEVHSGNTTVLVSLLPSTPPSMEEPSEDGTLYIYIAMSGAAVVLIVAAIIVISLIVCLKKRQKINIVNVANNVAYGTSKDRMELRENIAYGTTTFKGNEDGYEYVSTTVKDDIDITTFANEAYATTDNVPVFNNQAYGMLHH